MRTLCLLALVMVLVVPPSFVRVVQAVPSPNSSSSSSSSSSNWTNITVYRITPIQDRGVTNMNTADAAGDVYFGFSQLLLPYMCAAGGHGTWCNNRKWLSGGTAWMVYRKFILEVKRPFGTCKPRPTPRDFYNWTFRRSLLWHH